MTENVFTQRRDMQPDGRGETPLTLSTLKLLCEQLIAAGADPDREVLVYGDPEGNDLVSIDGWAGLSELSLKGMSIQVGDPVAIPHGVPTTARDRLAWLVANHPAGHVILTAHDTHFWKD